MKYLFHFLILVLISSQSLFTLDYIKPDFRIENVNLTFELDDTQTIVTSQLEIKRESKHPNLPLVLDGEKLRLISASLNGHLLKENEYQLTDYSLTIFNVPDHFNLMIVNEINPLGNTELEGLYKSNHIFCTQNESKGFRKITYFLDRPDVMAKYTTTLIADKKECPILLSNGNKIDFGDLEEGKHFVTWEDPYKKPSYLFALVAGDLGSIQDTFIRKSNKPVELTIFCEKGLESKCHHAMGCLKRAMKWDEDRFNLECDLDTYMIVAINDFNSGAMENKGLNIFNSSCILADSKTSTDAEFARIEGVIAHEYFHNWTGNRVTLRDWNELNVKEALTVFRDQEFSLDMNPWSKQRIEDVATLRQFQFPEDAGPTAHSIRPTESIDTRNLYSSTVYCKGPEIIRMIQTLIGKENFNKGMAKYFELYDGQAVATDQFIHAMEIASHKDLSQFQRWYDQKGTPHLKVKSEYDPKAKRLTLYTEQSNPKEGPDALALHFPLKIGLIDSTGAEIPLKSDLLEIKNKKETFIFENIPSQPTLSLNRDFSAPIIIETNCTPQDYAFLMTYDSNEFNRWEAARALSFSVLETLISDYQMGKKLQLPKDYCRAFQLLLKDPHLDPALKAEALIPPNESEIAQTQLVIDFDSNHYVRRWLIKELAQVNEELFYKTYQSLAKGAPYSIDSQAVADRELKNICLFYLTSLEKERYIDLCKNQFLTADNMTDQIAALCFLNLVNCPQRRLLLDQFYEQWKEDTLVLNKWLYIEASSPLAGTLHTVKSLTLHPAYSSKEPNKNRALIGGFFRNSIHFHSRDGSGYAFLENQISSLDEINPQTAATLAAAFLDFSKLDPERKKLMKKSLENLLQKKDLSSNTYEILNKILGSS